jgi:hypothetical protein
VTRMLAADDLRIAVRQIRLATLAYTRRWVEQTHELKSEASVIAWYADMANWLLHMLPS